MLNRPGQTSIESNPARARIARSIRHLVENYDAQPSLEDAAQVAGLSPYHFQREFSRLAGVSPKAFIGHLTLEHAKAKLAGGASVLDAALDAGLSGPSRLHDLCLKVESMTPGDYAKGGAGLVIRYGLHPTLLGTALLMVTERGLCGLAFADEGEEDSALCDMRARWPRAELVSDQSAIVAYAERIFTSADNVSRGRKPGEIPIQLFGTPWQIKVWQALLAIPEGEVVSYRTVAERVCTARASRATGAAIGRNPIALLIPCHRVLASSGAITGYRWGEPRKRALLALEAARAAA
jgi:AraC family transcriptional regulator of adaptative response/methylated-DNA-[protein]-cysteine methyltransferase